MTFLTFLAGPPDGELESVLFVEVLEGHMQWLWQGRIPLGAITLLDGDPGLGKSLITLDLAARVTTGRDMPDGMPGVEGAPFCSRWRMMPRPPCARVCWLEWQVQATLSVDAEAVTHQARRNASFLRDQPGGVHTPNGPPHRAVAGLVPLHEQVVALLGPSCENLYKVDGYMGSALQ